MTIVLLVALLVVSCAVAVYSFSAERERRTILVRASAMGGLNAPVPLDILRDDAPGLAGRLATWLRERTPKSWSEAGDASDVLLQAGFDGPEAPLFFTSIRLARWCCRSARWCSAPRHTMYSRLSSWWAAGVVGPRAVLDRWPPPQDRIRKSIPTRSTCSWCASRPARPRLGDAAGGATWPGCTPSCRGELFVSTAG
jgi:hypothetical protein